MEVGECYNRIIREALAFLYDSGKSAVVPDLKQK